MLTLQHFFILFIPLLFPARQKEGSQQFMCATNERDNKNCRGMFTRTPGAVDSASCTSRDASDTVIAERSYSQRLYVIHGP